MAKLLVFVGLPGSGKTHWINALPEQAFPKENRFDDFMACAINDTPLFKFSRHYLKLIEQLRRGKNCAIADIRFCDTPFRIETEKVMQQIVPSVDIEWLFFENSPQKCEKRVERSDRSDLQKRKDMILYFTKRYFVPDGVVPLKVWEEPCKGS